MPATSKAQQRFFGYLHAHPAEAERRGISGKVADEFAHAPGGSTKGLPERAHKQPGARGRMMHMHKMRMHLPMMIIHIASLGKSKRPRQAGARGGYDFMRLKI